MPRSKESGAFRGNVAFRRPCSLGVCPCYLLLLLLLEAPCPRRPSSRCSSSRTVSLATATAIATNVPGDMPVMLQLPQAAPSPVRVYSVTGRPCCSCIALRLRCPGGSRTFCNPTHPPFGDTVGYPRGFALAVPSRGVCVQGWGVVLTTFKGRLPAIDAVGRNPPLDAGSASTRECSRLSLQAWGATTWGAVYRCHPSPTITTTSNP